MANVLYVLFNIYERVQKTQIQKKRNIYNSAALSGDFCDYGKKSYDEYYFYFQQFGKKG